MAIFYFDSYLKCFCLRLYIVWSLFCLIYYHPKHPNGGTIVAIEDARDLLVLKLIVDFVALDYVGF